MKYIYIYIIYIYIFKFSVIILYSQKLLFFWVLNQLVFREILSYIRGKFQHFSKQTTEIEIFTEFGEVWSLYVK